MNFKDAMLADVDSVFMNTEEFADIVIYRSESRNVQWITEYNEDADSFYTMIIGSFADFDGIDTGDVIEKDGMRYRVIDGKPDDMKMTYLIYVNEEL